MTVQTFTLTADVPDDQTTAAQASCAAFVQTFAADVEGAAVLAAVLAGESLLPDPADEYESALSALEELSGPGKRPAAADLQAAVERVRAASVAWEACMHPVDVAPAASGIAADPSGMVVANESPTPAPVPPFAPADSPQPAAPATQPAPVYAPPAVPAAAQPADAPQD